MLFLLVFFIRNSHIVFWHLPCNPHSLYCWRELFEIPVKKNDSARKMFVYTLGSAFADPKNTLNQTAA
ncbi:hypothetical protein EMIT0P44_380002 [Pseudomonas sp. IT-P44]